MGTAYIVQETRTPESIAEYYISLIPGSSHFVDVTTVPVSDGLVGFLQNHSSIMRLCIVSRRTGRIMLRADWELGAFTPEPIMAELQHLSSILVLLTA